MHGVKAAPSAWENAERTGKMQLSSEAAEGVTVGAARRCYARGEIILWTDEGTDSSLLFLSGSARIYRLSEEGKEVTLREVHAGDVMPVVSGKSYVEATTNETVVARLPRRQFLQRVLLHPDLRLQLTEHLCAWLLDAYDTIEDFWFHDVYTRLAHLLARLAPRHGAHLSYTREQLGQMVGASRQEVTGALADFRTRGWISYETRRPRDIQVVNVRALKSGDRNSHDVS